MLDTASSATWLASSSLTYLICTVAIVLLVQLDVVGIGSRYRTIRGVPVVGAKSSLEPSWVTRYRFTLSGWSIVQNGWSNIRSGIFTVIRPESNITVIPRKYVEELSRIPNERLAASESIVNDMMRQYSQMSILLGSHLGHDAIKKKMNPQLSYVINIVEEELLVAASEDPLPVTDEWSDHQLSHYVSKLLARFTSRGWVGIPLCRDPTWLQLKLDLVKSVFETAVVMRNLPRFTHPLMAPVLPSRRRLVKCINEVHGFLIPLIEERRAQEKLQGSSYEKPQDVMQWMMDLANEEESDPANLATRFVYTILGSVQTVVEVIMNCIYELCVRPEYIGPLRDEMEAVLKEEGGWTKQGAAKMIMTDSFTKEVFRHYAPSAFAFKRITKEEIILSDGLVLPKDTYVCVATTSASQDDMEDSDQDRFDGYRYVKKRAAQSAPSSRHDFASTDKSHISFGHGRYACPGRLVASIEIKMVLAHLLLQYDIRLPNGKLDRPKSLQLLEFQFLDPDATVMLRKRKG